MNIVILTDRLAKDPTIKYINTVNGQRPSYLAEEEFMNIPENAGEDIPFI